MNFYYPVNVRSLSLVVRVKRVETSARPRGTFSDRAPERRDRPLAFLALRLLILRVISLL